MNEIQRSMKDIRASEELKRNTLCRLGQQTGRGRLGMRLCPGYALAVACLAFLLGMGIGGYSVYRMPVSYISVDINPSIELGINRFGRVVSVVAYDEEWAQAVGGLRLEHAPFVQAIDRLIGSEGYRRLLREDGRVVYTVISADSHAIIAQINRSEAWQAYGGPIYTSDMSCMEEAHQYDMSFGKYRAYQELAQYDGSVTVEECHNMTMREIQDRIDGCRRHGGQEGGSGHHGSRHGSLRFSP